MAVDTLVQFLSVHQTEAYIILFLGSYFETLIGFSFFVYGEIIFLSGAILAGPGALNIWWVILAFYAGGILGDQSSYAIGFLWGERYYRFFSRVRFFKIFFSEKNYERGVDFFKRFGGWSVFLGRFLGPVSWIMPFLAGSFKLRYKTFVIFDTPAVILGIGQFIVVGYFIGKGYQVFLPMIEKYVGVSVFIFFVVIIVLYFFRQTIKRGGTVFRKKMLRWAGRHIVGKNKSSETLQ